MGTSFGALLRSALILAAATVLCMILWMTPSAAQQGSFRNAPSSAAGIKNPYAGNGAAAAAGKKLYAQNCAHCHGKNQQGMGPAPALDSSSVRSANAGELFWFISTGKLADGMPGWSNLPKQQRWQIVTFLQMPANGKSGAK
ncbi:MAG: c-type cytochrome [Candidatus Korobacteraceae bacterium]